MCLSAGQVGFPKSWSLTEATIGKTPLCLDPAAAHPLTGSLTLTGLPLLKLPPGIAPPTLTVSFDGENITLATTVGLPNKGKATVTLAVNQTTGAYAGSVKGSFTAFDKPISLSGKLAVDASGNVSVKTQLTGQITLGQGVTLSDASFTWNASSFGIAGTIKINNTVSLTASGSYADADNWSLALSAVVGAWQPLPQLTIPSIGFAGSVSKSEGEFAFDASVTVARTMETGRLGDRGQSHGPPVQQRRRTLRLPWYRQKSCLAGRLGFGDHRRRRRFAAQAVRPGVRGARRQSVGVQLHHRDRRLETDQRGGRHRQICDGQRLLEGHRRLRLRGVRHDQRLWRHPHRGGERQQRQVLHRRLRRNYQRCRCPPAQRHAAAMCCTPVRSAAATNSLWGRVNRPFTHTVTVPAGVSLYGSFVLKVAKKTDTAKNSDTSTVPAVIADKLGLKDDVTAVISASLTGGPPVFRASIAFGKSNGGSVLYENCGGKSCPADGQPVAKDSRTALSLSRLSLTLSATGSIGFEATANLAIAKSNETPASNLGLTARITVDLAGPKITAALFTSDGQWNGRARRRRPEHGRGW